jgi:hypothetical protein
MHYLCKLDHFIATRKMFYIMKGSTLQNEGVNVLQICFILGTRNFGVNSPSLFCKLSRFEAMEKIVFRYEMV